MLGMPLFDREGTFNLFSFLTLVVRGRVVNACSFFQTAISPWNDMYVILQDHSKALNCEIIFIFLFQIS